jgi:hypothetical protein
MGQLPYHARLLNEALSGFAVRQFLGEEFDGHQTADEWIVGPGYAPVGSRPDNFKNFVSSDLHQMSLPGEALFLTDGASIRRFGRQRNEARVMFFRGTSVLGKNGRYRW